MEMPQTTNRVTLPDLPYGYDELEPVISKEIMELHHKKHHNGYVTKFNEALDNWQQALAENDFQKMIGLNAALKFNGGGHINHSIFWTNLAPKNKGGGQFHDGELKGRIDQDFTSLDKFKEDFNLQATALQGSGWVWLGWCKRTKRLYVISCQNQDPLSTKGFIPLLGLDVWEHAYYLQYKNVRPDYIKAFWEIINWHNVEERYLKAIK